jgi:hypothetical protein
MLSLKDIISIGIYEAYSTGPPRGDDTEMLRYKEPVLLGGIGALGGVLITRKIQKYQDALKSEEAQNAVKKLTKAATE